MEINNIPVGKKNVVKYNPDFNNFNISNLTMLEMDLFIGIITQMKDCGSDKQRINYSDLSDILELKSIHGKKARSMLEDLSDKFSSVKFIQQEKKQNSFRQKTMPIFSMLEIYVDYDNVVGNSFFDVEISPKITDLFNNLEKWVVFDLLEFARIKNKNAKILYKLFKQFKKTGRVEIPLDKYKMLLGIDENTEAKNVNRLFVKRPLKSLEPFFKNLKVEQKKHKRKTTGYIFTFEPEQTNKQTLKKGYKKRPAHSHKEIATDWSKYAPTPTNEKSAKLKKSNNSDLNNILSQLDSQGVNS